MPRGLVWDMVDYVPVLLDTQLTGRGAWSYACDPITGGDIEGGIYAPYKNGDKLLAIGGLAVWDVNRTTGAVSSPGAAPHLAQNPVFFNDAVIIPDRDQLAVPKMVTE